MSNAGAQSSHSEQPKVTPPQTKYKYKVTILNSRKRGKKAITRQLHLKTDKFDSVTAMKVHLMDELGDEVPSSIHFEVGYYEKRSNKCWLVKNEDLQAMYSSLKSGNEVLLWCDCSGIEPSCDDKKSAKKRSSSASSSSEDVDELFDTLTQMHEDKYTIPQRRLWARTIHCGTHDSFDTPPALPMFGPPPKQARRASLSDAVAAAIAKAAVSPSTIATTSESLPKSPGKTADVRMKYLQQLRFIQQLFQDGILTESEYEEQKANILAVLRSQLELFVSNCVTIP